MISNIRKIREAKGYSQEYMAIKLGISQNGYFKIEAGKVSLKVKELFDIAQILGTNINELIQIEKPIDSPIGIHTVDRNKIDEMLRLLKELLTVKEAEISIYRKELLLKEAELIRLKEEYKNN